LTHARRARITHTRKHLEENIPEPATARECRFPAALPYPVARGRSTGLRDLTRRLPERIAQWLGVPNLMKRVCVAARIGDSKAPGEANT